MDGKDNKESKEFNVKLLLIVIGGIAVFAPITVNIGMYFLDIPTASALGGGAWLSFWGSYLGGLTGCIAALAALWATFQQSKRQQLIDEENRRIAALPAINAYFKYLPLNNNDDYNDATRNADHILHFEAFPGTKPRVINNFFLFELTKVVPMEKKGGCFGVYIVNIGMGPVLQLQLRCGDAEIPILLRGLGVGEKRKLLLVLPTISEAAQATVTLTFQYQDIFGHGYTQEQSIQLPPPDDGQRRRYKFIPITHPERISPS